MDKGTDTKTHITDTTSGSSIPFEKEVDNETKSRKFDRIGWKKDKIAIKTPIKTKQTKNFAMRKI